MKRRTFMRTYGSRVALTFLLLCLIVYTVYHAVGNSSGALLTTPAKQISDTRLLGGEAWLFREEQVLSLEDPAVVNSLAVSGSKVGKNSKLAEVWSSGDAATAEQKQQELDRINRSITVLQNSLQTDSNSAAQADRYQSAAGDRLMQIKLALREGNWSVLGALEDELLTLLNQYSVLAGSRQELEEALTLAEAERAALLQGDCRTLVNDRSSAYYYDRSCVDGYESLFTAKALSNLTAGAFYELIEQPPQTEAHVAGKLCYEYNWYLAISFSSDAAALFEKQVDYRIRFPQNQDRELILTCEKLLTDSEKGTVVVFRSEVTPLDFRYWRRQSVEITVGSQNGFYIPQQVMIYQNGMTGVYIFEESKVCFRRIAVLYEGDGYVIAAIEDPAPQSEIPYLARNDLIITSGKNLYDGKVYE